MGLKPAVLAGILAWVVAAAVRAQDPFYPTRFPAIQTVCPPSVTECPYDCTVCPIDRTWCPPLATRCGWSGPTQCEPTRCTVPPDLLPRRGPHALPSPRPGLRRGGRDPGGPAAVSRPGARDRVRFRGGDAAPVSPLARLVKPRPV